MSRGAKRSVSKDQQMHLFLWIYELDIFESYIDSCSHHPEDGHTSSRSMLVTSIQKVHKTKEHLLDF
jgi:hypothetical protein